MNDRSVWVKASKSGPDSNCVEQARPGASVLVRDTKQQGEGPVLAMAPAAYSAWVAAAKVGEFDALI